jgi:uncharacterized protein YyaL (SSP411 family)
LTSNHLSAEKSPYLKQHAQNPVDWYPWGEEAFAKARGENKAIFLSIGYSTCHWCHVMERESFESEPIAEVLNRHFVSIKVDREERPDVDRIYMTFVQASTGSGGWPMSVFLTPELRPFFGGTYFPPDNRYGRPGFQTLLERIAEAWQNDRDRVVESGDKILEQLREQVAHAAGGQALDKSVLDATYNYFRRSYDKIHGGFGGAPKFPRPAALEFLLRYHHHNRNDEALKMTLHTLRAMAEGGMHDQLGGGFHRYSVDERWFVSHFEKMLYDQAQLAITYLEAFQITRDAFYADIARDIFEYVLRDMTSPEGGFYSAEDADSPLPENPSEKGEGAFYVWTRQEIDAILGHPAAASLRRRYGVEASGNVSDDPHGEFQGKNILFVKDAREPLDTEAAASLLEARSRRPRPHLDDKILTAWNGLMISAFAKGGQILDEPRYAEAGRRAADLILSRMLDPGSGALLRRFRDGDAAIPGFLDDYAFFIAALLDLYEMEFDPARIEQAETLTAKMRELFEDAEHGAFFTTARGDASLMLRVKDDYDGAEPSGNSIALMDLLRLAQITNRPDYRRAVERALAALAARVASQPVAVPLMLSALYWTLSPVRQIILIGLREDALTQAFLREARARFLPDSITLLIDSEDTRQRLARFIPELAGMKQVDGKTTAYVCRDYTCQLPTSEVSRFVELLQ